MGDFSRTCAVSRLAIEEGDDVFYIYINKPDMSCYDLLQYLRMDVDQEILKKEFTCPATMASLNRDPYVKFGFGTYSGYGDVNEVDFPDEDNSHLILIRKAVADELYKFGASLIDREWSYRKENERGEFKKNYAYCVALVAHLTRIELFGYQLLGRQYPDVDEFKETARVWIIILKEFVKKFLEVYKEHLEYKNWSFWVDLKYRLVKFASKIFSKEA